MARAVAAEKSLEETAVKQPDEFKFTDPSVQECPYEFYGALRAKAPVYKVPETGFYIVSSHELIMEALRQPLVFSSRQGFRPGLVPEEVRRIFEEEGYGEEVPTLVSNDPPEHTRFRRLVEHAFTPKRVAAMEPYMADIIDEAIDAFIERGEAEIVAEFSVPIPMKIIADQLGVAREDMDKFKLWSDASVEPLGMMISKERHIECARLLVEFERYFVDRLEERRRKRTDDMLSDLVYAQVEGERPLDTRELLSICRQLLVAGNETTTNTITSGIWLLATHPTQVRVLREKPELYGRLAEEVLRYESPVQGLFRMTTQDVELGGVTLPKGSVVNLRYGAANRDECVFADAERFDPQRTDARRHLAFGNGIHHCIGQALARQEIKLALKAIVERLDNLRLADADFAVEHHPSMILRGIKRLPVKFEKRQLAMVA